MANFEHIKRGAGARQATAVIEIEGLAGMRPRLKCRPANESNPSYFNALLKRQRRGIGRIGRRVDVSTIRRMRDDDRFLIAFHCVISWDENSVFDADGNRVEFNCDECFELFQALPDDIFDDFRNEVSDPSTFEELDDPEDVEAQGKN